MSKTAEQTDKKAASAADNVLSNLNSVRAGKATAANTLARTPVKKRRWRSGVGVAAELGPGSPACTPRRL